MALIQDYRRSFGLRLTYRIRVDDRGEYCISLRGKELLRGHDRLAAGGRRSLANKLKLAGALNEAQRAIESLSGMPEC